MKKSISSLFISLAALSVFFFSSCEIGMGEAVDLEAPELTIETPSRNNAFVPRNFTIEGTAVDNIGCEKVTFEYKYTIDGVEYSGVKECGVSGNRFSCPFTFEKDVEVSFEICAHDKNNNTSEKSSASRTYIIDSNDPKVGKVAIRRGNYIVRLLQLTDFTNESTGKTALRDYPENKDYFQNQSFALFFNLKDSYGIGGAQIKLYEDSNLIIEKTMSEDTENKFSPEFEFTESELIAASPSLATGVHYLRPVLAARDTAGNLVTEEKDYLAFESAYDIPHVKYNSMIGEINNGGKITVCVEGSIPITVFDDDGLKSIDYKFVKLSDFTNYDSISDFSSIIVEAGLRDKSFDLTAPDVDGSYKLVLKVSDTNSPSTNYINAVDLKVTNGDAAAIVINSPHENSVPSLNEGNFTIEGYTIDNQPVSNIAVAWLPNGNADIAKAEDFFETYDFSADTTVSGTSSVNMKIYKLTPGIATVIQGRHQNTFSKSFNFFDDFKDKTGKVTNDTKVFMFACKDTTGNITLKTFRLNKFTSKPSFTVKYKYADETSFDKESSDPLIMCKLAKTQFKIIPNTENNMPIEECTVTANETAGFVQIQGFEKNTTNNYVAFELTNGSNGAPLSGQQFHLTLYAKDKLGAETTNNLTIAFEEVGQLESIDADYVTGSILTANDTLILQANFTHRVVVDTKGGTKVPFIQLSGTNFKKKNGDIVAAADRRAYLIRGNESNTLYFEYKIPAGVELEAENLSIPVGTDNEPTINLNDAEVEGEFSKNNVGTAFNNKHLKLDSIAPYIVAYSPGKNGVIESTVIEGVRSVDISLTFNEPVEIESGSLVLQRTTGWYIPPVISEDVFLKLFYSDAAIKDTSLRTTLCGSATNVRTDKSTDRLGNETMLPDGPYMQYTQGLVLPEVDDDDTSKDSTEVVPDISTKYVLKYSLNIDDATGTVESIRNALETLAYHKAEFDIQSLKPSDGGKTLTITITDEDFIDCLKNGVEYFLTLTAESVRDAAFNYLAKSKSVEGIDYAIAPASGGADPEYKFWIGPVAKPVVRVNRKATNADNDKPKGKTDIKIDCETPGATISWGSHMNEVTGLTYTFKDDDYSNSEKTELKSSCMPINVTPVDVMRYGDVKDISCSSIGTVNGTKEIKDAVGDGEMTKASKTYIKAFATKTGMISSKPEYEGAFKTMVHYEEPKYYTVDWNDGGKGKQAGRNTYNGNEFKIFGAQIPEGGSYTSGWPLTQNGYENRHQYQIAYKGTTNYNYYWESWQILTNFCMQTNAGYGKFQQPANTECSYGVYIYGYRVKYD